MGRQISLLLVAVQFLTRLPVPSPSGFRPDWTARSARYFPVVGAGVGLICGIVLLGAAWIWDGLLPALLAVVAGVLVTGAFHEDGLADTFDGLGGGQTRSRRLEIMKDSRIGTFGALGLGLAIAVKVAALADLSPLTGAAALIAAHAGGRGAAVLAMRLLPYAGDREQAKVKPTADGVTRAEAWMACLAMTPALAVLGFVSPPALGAGVLCGGMLALFLSLTASRLIGGWVGDTLGATEQMFEIGFLAAVAGVAGVAGSA